MAFDYSKVQAITAMYSADQDVDICQVTTIGEYIPVDVAERVTVDFPPVYFEGIVQEINVLKTQTNIKIVGLSLLLKRQEDFSTAPEGDITLSSAATQTAGTGFEVIVEGDDPVKDYSSLSASNALELLKAYADLAGKHLYIYNSTIYYFPPEGRSNVINIPGDYIELDERRKIGGSDFFTYVSGSITTDSGEEISLKVPVFPNPAIEIVKKYDEDQLSRAGVKDEDSLRSFLQQEAQRYRLGSTERTITVHIPIGLMPYDVVQIQGEEYLVKSVTYKIQEVSFEIEVKLGARS